MVKTRHSGDVDVESPPTFLSLSNEKNRLATRSGDALASGEDKNVSKTYREDRDAYNIFNEKVVESRLRPRIGPRRAYNYLDVESSDEDSLRRQTHHSINFSTRQQMSRFTRSNRMKQEMETKHRSNRDRSQRTSLHEDQEQSVEEDDDDNGANTTKKSQSRELISDKKAGSRRRQVRPTPKHQHCDSDEFEEEEDDDEIENRRRKSRRRHDASDDEEDETDTFIRRSSRTRRQVYDTLNQSFLVSRPGQKTRASEEGDQSDNKDQEDSEDNKVFSDMYSRVKRKRVQVKRNMYGVPINDDSDSEHDKRDQNKNNNKNEDDEDSQGNSDDNFDGDDTENQADGKRVNTRRMKKKEPTVVKSYSLREHKPRTNLYKAPVEERRIRRIHSIFAVTPTKKGTNQTYQSPAQRRNVRKRSAFHSSSSSTSSGSESSDEKNFKHRKAKSMAKARSRMMPMNFSSNALPPSNVIKDRVKSGASLADVEPMNIDRNITFSSIGGLGKHIRALKEMVVFPLLYDEVFQLLNVDPPRGVLFYGPPGTGKTLVARALANECSHGDRRVAFFMRKGADCLSKWVGESERQLRLLFDQAYKFRPSIIFFDEIDGLAPVRSSRQDQIHSSIVSTLLALMDGLDSRGEIVVIGATNRIDSLDPALRRPGRFDREFLFPLPSLEARKQILKIHTASWTPKLNEQFISELAEKCVGYCGADLKALVTEAAMLALRRRYPQIYITNEALQLDVTSINVSARDFFDAVNNIIPTSQRAANSPARALAPRVYHLLQRQFNIALKQLSDIFPPCLAEGSTSDTAATSSQVQLLAENGVIWDELASDEDDDTPSIFVSPSNKGKALMRKSDQGSSTSPTYLKFSNSSRPSTFRPRLMIVGNEGQGQTTYIAPAIIHKMENLPVHVLDLPALYAVTAKTPEESCANVFHEAKRKCPSIIYLPYINQWWDVMAETLRATLLTLIHDLNPSLPLLLLATSEQPYTMLDPVLQSLFSHSAGEIIEMKDPNSDERRTFFKELLLNYSRKPPPQKKQAAQRILEVLPKAIPPKPRELTQQELDQLIEKEELTLMELRIFLRDVLNKLGSDKKFSIFAKPVNREEAPDYYEIIENPMDLSTMMAKIDLHEYGTVRAFMNDIDFICSNALEYNPNRGPMDRVIRHRACALKDTAYAIIKTELDKDFEKMCVEIEESRKRRGEKSTSVPNFYFTKPNTLQQPSRSQTVTSSCLENLKQTRTIPKPEGERFSRRVRGLNIDPVPPLEAVEKVFKMSRVASPQVEENRNNSNEESRNVLINESDRKSLESESRSSTSGTNISTRDERQVKNGPKTTPGNKLLSPDSSASKTKKTNKCVWCKPKRKRMRFSSKNLTSRQVAERQEEDMNHEECEDETSFKDNQESDIHKQLSIETAVQEYENKEQKTPAQTSSRLRSPNTSSTVRVSTRRSSMSPCNTINADLNTSNQFPNKNIETTKDINSQIQLLSTAVDKKEKSDSTENENPLPASNQTEAVKQPVSINRHSTEPSDKPSVVKRLDLDLVAMDSGVGSSVDSNGDSRDSTDHNREGNSLKTSLASVAITDLNQNSNFEMTSRATAILEEPVREVIIDVNRLTSLLNRLVARTDGYNVDRLEKIYSHLNQIIYRHRHNYNRTAMVLELEKKVEDLTKIVSQSSSNVHQ